MRFSASTQATWRALERERELHLVFFLRRVDELRHGFLQLDELRPDEQEKLRVDRAVQVGRLLLAAGTEHRDELVAVVVCDLDGVREGADGFFGVGLVSGAYVEVHRELDVDVVLVADELLEVVEDLGRHVGEEVRVLAELEELREVRLPRTGCGRSA